MKDYKIGWKVPAYLHSKKVGEKQGEKEEVEIIDSETYDRTTTYKVLTASGVKCTAIFNPFTNSYYADDKYGIVKE